MQHGAWNSLQVLGPDRNWCFLWFLAGTYTCPEKELERMSQHIFWSSTWRFGFASTSFHPQTFSCLFCIIKKAMPKAHFPYCKRRKYVCKFRSQQHCSEHMRDKDGNEISRLGHAKNTTLVSLYDSLSGDAWLRMGNHGPMAQCTLGTLLRAKGVQKAAEAVEIQHQELTDWIRWAMNMAELKICEHSAVTIGFQYIPMNPAESTCATSMQARLWFWPLQQHHRRGYP